MTEQEKLTEMLSLIKSFWKDDQPIEMCKALIQRYPQILAEKVWEGQSCLIESEQFTGTDGKNKLSLVWSNTNEKVNKTIEVFIREVKE